MTGEIISHGEFGHSNRLNRCWRENGACRAGQACQAGFTALESSSGNGPHHRAKKIKMALKYPERGIKKTQTIFCLINSGIDYPEIDIRAMRQSCANRIQRLSADLIMDY
ncbi:MAG: hypothetical protein V4764_26630 [Burkholderia sp.]